MSPAEYASKPYSFILKYSRRASGTRYEQAERVRKAIEQYKCARDPESGEIYLRPDGPAYAACMRFLRDVEAGLYEGKLWCTAGLQPTNWGAGVDLWVGG
jgi:hypothetical protein